MYGLRRTVDAATEPITLDEAKLHLRVTGADEDDLINNCIVAARQHFEDATNRALINQTWVLTLDRWFLRHEVNRRWLYLPKSPLSSVTSVYYVDENGDSTLWDSSNYNVDTNSEPGRLELGYDKTWPVTRDQVNAITITYVAGYGSSASDVPQGIKSAILLLVADLYQNRETFTTGTVRTPLVGDRFLMPWMVGDSYFDFGGVE